MKHITIIWTLCFLFSFSAFAQNDNQVNAPKVGLVLSGGGAKGMAHIGVLKVIDSLGIKIDYIAGTSMGAFVGGLYASGYTGNQIDSIFKNVDFDNILNDNIPRTSQAFFERNNSEKYALTLPFNKFKLKLPSALSKGHHVFSTLSQLTLHVNNIDDFQNLPIPFFCVATNIETGGQVILDKGSLALSIMASGALPSLYTPVTIDDNLLIDGGVANNYPVEELRQKGVDIIIGVDVQEGLLPKEEIVSATNVLMQINNFRSALGMVDKMKSTNIYIKPDIKNYSVVSFDERLEIISSGIHASHKKISELEALPKKAIAETSQFSAIKPTDSIIINSFKFEGKTNYSRAYLLGKLKLKTKEKICYKTFSKGINNLIATYNFDSFQYQLKPTQNPNEYDLHVKLQDSKNKAFLKLGIHYDDLYKSAALINLTQKQFLFNNDIASLDVILGDNVRYNFEYFLDKGFYWSIGLRSRYNTFKKNISAKLLLSDSEISTTGINKMDVRLEDLTNQFYLQTLLRKDFALSLGAEHKRLDIKSETLLNTNETDDFTLDKTDYFSVFGNIKLDSYSNKYFPKHGVLFTGDIHSYLLASNFNKNFNNFSIVKADLGYAFSMSNKMAFNLQASSGLKLGDKNTQTLDFALGGNGNNLINNFIPFIGYDFISLTGNSFVKTAAIADYEIFKKHHLTFEINWAIIEDDIFESVKWLKLPDYSGYGLGYGIETLIGPIQIKYSYSPELEQSIWFFNVGFWF